MADHTEHQSAETLSSCFASMTFSTMTFQFRTEFGGCYRGGCEKTAASCFLCGVKIVDENKKQQEKAHTSMLMRGAKSSFPDRKILIESMRI